MKETNREKLEREIKEKEIELAKLKKELKHINCCGGCKENIRSISFC